MQEITLFIFIIYIIIIYYFLVKDKHFSQG